MMFEAKRHAALCLAAVLAAGCFAPAAFADEGAVTLRFDGGNSEMVAAGAKLFSREQNGLPGDTFAGELVVSNGSTAPCEFFTAARDVTAKGPDDTLERIGFTASLSADDVLFDGTLSEADAAEPISLGMVEPGGTVSVDYEMRVPMELTSEYADALVGMNVAVSAVMHPDEIADPPQGSGNGASLSRTGDGEPLLPVAAAGLGVGGLGAAAALLLRRRWRW